MLSNFDLITAAQAQPQVGVAARHPRCGFLSSVPILNQAPFRSRAVHLVVRAGRDSGTSRAGKKDKTSAREVGHRSCIAFNRGWSRDANPAFIETQDASA